MQDIRFAWASPDGSINITQLGDAALAVKGDDDAKIAYAVARMKEAGAMPANATVAKITKADIPTDRKYREAWRLSAGRIAIDAQKKAEIDARPTVKTIEERIAALESKAVNAGR